MRSTLLFSTLLGSFAIGTNGLEAPIEGYGVVDLEWDVEVHPGQPTQKFHGTVEQVVAEAVKIRPDWVEAYGLTNKTTDDQLLAERETWDTYDQFATWNCNWPKADLGAIISGINYLWNLPAGTPTNGPGPGNCGRVSCSYNSAIWWCNDQSVTRSLSSWKSIANGAMQVENQCKNVGFTFYLGGQAFHPTSYNVIVREDSC